MCKQAQIEFIHAIRKNKFARTLATPFMNEKYQRQLKKFVMSEDSKYIQTLRNTYAGERCFIVGNGPSLNPQDLELIKDEFSFAFNRIYYIFDKTGWRPSCYMCIDHSVIDLNREAIKRLDFPIKLLDIYAKKYKYEDKNTHYICCENVFSKNKRISQSIGFSHDLSICYCVGGTVTYTAIQMAVFMGFAEIYLLGIDHNYSIMQRADGSTQKNEDVKNYFEGLKATGTTLLNIDIATAAYKQAKETCESKGVQIYNATRGGKLDVFDRVVLNELQM